ncbi:MAG: hypothetical protein HKL90_13935 [Elusimicrobia bacterium]|nr:hypothetical protein [Elusimicrobiota bacterium]
MKTIAYAALTAAILTAGSLTPRVWAQSGDGAAPQAADSPAVRGQGDGSGPAGGPAARMMKRMQARTAMAKLRQQLDAKASDDDVKATLAQLREARRQMRAQEDKFIDSASSFLTPTQQAKMLLGAMKMHGRRHGRGPGRVGSGGPPEGGSDARSNDD